MDQVDKLTGRLAIAFGYASFPLGLTVAAVTLAIASAAADANIMVPIIFGFSSVTGTFSTCTAFARGLEEAKKDSLQLNTPDNRH